MCDYERTYDHGGFEITKTPKGWVVEGWSRVQGCRTNYRYWVRPSKDIPHDADLEADWNESYEFGEIIAVRALERPDKVLARGWIVE